MIPEDEPKFETESYPCECGGTIRKIGSKWECDTCEWSESGYPQELQDAEGIGK